MSISELTDYFLRYGAFFIYLIVLLEYLNLPGFPAGVIMPLAGIWAAKGEISFPMVMVLTCGSAPNNLFPNQTETATKANKNIT